MAGGNAAARSQPQGTGVGTGNVGKRAVVQIQQGPLGSFKKNGFLGIDGFKQHLGGIGDGRQERRAPLHTFVKDGIGLHRGGVVEGAEQFVFVGDDFSEFLLQFVGLSKIRHPHGVAASDLVGVAGADASFSGADFVLAEGFLPQAVFEFVIVEHHVSVFADKQPALQRDAAFVQCADFFHQDGGVHDDAVGNDAPASRADGAAGQQVQSKPLVSDDDRMACVGSAVIANDQVALFGQNIDYFSFALIAPLQTCDTAVHPTRLPFFSADFAHQCIE